VAVTVPLTVEMVSAPVGVGLLVAVMVPVALAALVASGVDVAVLVGAPVALGAVVAVKVGGGVFEGGRLGVGRAACVSAANVPASAIAVACESPAEIGDNPGTHAFNPTDRIKIAKARRRLIMYLLEVMPV